MRRTFAEELYNHMKTNDKVWLVTADLGYGMFDKIRDDFPDRFLNTGAAEQAACGIAVGLAMSGKIPFLYSITPFLLYRPFETIRNYINHEQIPVKLVGSGRDDDYKHDGFSHYAGDDWKLFEPIYTWSKKSKDWVFNDPMFINIESKWPRRKEEIPSIVKEMIETEKPYYLNLRR